MYQRGGAVKVSDPKDEFMRLKDLAYKWVVMDEDGLHSFESEKEAKKYIEEKLGIKIKLNTAGGVLKCLRQHLQ